MTSKASVQHINPEELPKYPGFSQAVAVTGPVKTVYVGGQNAVNASGDVVGKGDIAAQTEQVFRNLTAALAAAGAELGHVIKWNINLVEGQPIEPGFEVFQRVWDKRCEPPIVTVAIVSGLAHPDFLVELEAVAVVPT